MTSPWSIKLVEYKLKAMSLNKKCGCYEMYQTGTHNSYCNCPCHATPKKSEPWISIEGALIDLEAGKATVPQALEWIKKYVLQERSKDTVGEFLRKLPEEKIIHSYMSKQGEHSTEYCEGWNDYRLVAIQKLSEQLNQK